MAIIFNRKGIELLPQLQGKCERQDLAPASKTVELRLCRRIMLMLLLFLLPLLSANHCLIHTLRDWDSHVQNFIDPGVCGIQSLPAAHNSLRYAVIVLHTRCNIP